MWRDLLMFGLGGVATGVGALLARERARRVPIVSGWPRVVVVGAGFAGLRVARALAGAEADVLVIDRHNYHCFQPLLYQVATAALEPEEIAHPVRQILRGLPNVRFRMASVESIDLEAREVRTDVGPIPYDYLVMAAGSATNYFGKSDLEARSGALKGLNEAVALRNHLLACFERAMHETDPARRAALLTFVVAGGGPTGVEFAGALVELIRHVLVHDYDGLDVRESRVILLESGNTVLPPFDPTLQKATLRALRTLGVDVRLGSPVANFDGERITLADGQTIATHSLVWAAGVRGADVGSQLGIPLARGGRIKVDDTLRMPEHPEVYVVGDLAYFEQNGKPLPMLAPVAIQQGEHAAVNIRRQLRGEEPLPFVYQDKGTMATIGRNSAVCQIGALKLTGVPAWWVWLVVHLLQIISFRNRMLVLINWIWDYFFFDRAVRLITEN
ncbi:MAG TPA: NAD(P)/FAD-dependent oxidoreductase [Chloroflexota bacterium]|nr:NAD(P)/FAD-dependent oxidoreductase [Chloroflexota bacterium]